MHNTQPERKDFDSSEFFILPFSILSRRKSRFNMQFRMLALLIRRRYHVDEFWPFSRRKLLMPSAAVCLSVTILPTGPSILPDGASRRLRSRRCASTKTASRIVHSDGSATAGRAGRSSATVILARNRQESRRTYERRTFSGTDSQPCFVRRSARGGPPGVITPRSLHVSMFCCPPDDVALALISSLTTWGGRVNLLSVNRSWGRRVSSGSATWRQLCICLARDHGVYVPTSCLDWRT